MSKFQTGFLVYWAETAEILGRDEKFQTGTPHFFTRGGGQQVHEYGKYLSVAAT